MESNLRSRVAEFEAGYFLPLVLVLVFVFVFVFCKPAPSSFSVGFLKSGGWCLASSVEYGWSVRFVILFPGVCGERNELYYSVSYCGVMSGFFLGDVFWEVQRMLRSVS